MSHGDDAAHSNAPTILLVEDEPLIRLLSNDTLTDAGFHVMEAGNADEALIMLQAKPQVAAIVTDVRMPGAIDGFGLAHLVANRWPHMGIVVSSAHVLPGEGDLPDGSEFLPKPYQLSLLIAAVRKVVGQEVGPVAIIHSPGARQ